MNRIKTKLAAAKVPLPVFSSDEDAAGYFATHSIADAWDELPAANWGFRGMSISIPK